MFEQSIEINNQENTLSELNTNTISIKSIAEILDKIRQIIAGELDEYIDSFSNRIVLTIEKKETTIYDYLCNIHIIISNEDFIEILEEKKKFLEEMKISDFRSLVREALVKIKAKPQIDEYGFYGITINNSMHIQFALTQEMIKDIVIEEYLPTLKIYEKTFEE